MRHELVIGRVRTAHGVRGELKVESYSGETDHFLKLGRVMLVRGEERREFVVESMRPAHRVVLVKLQGVDSPETAKKWRGWEIQVPRGEASALADDEHYLGDLVGIRVIHDGNERGVVSAVLEGAGTVLLEVTVGEGGTRLVPFQAEFVTAVDEESGVLTLSTDEVLE